MERAPATPIGGSAGSTTSRHHLPRRVVHVTNDFRLNATGITDFVRALAVAQAGEGHDVVVLCRSSCDAMRALMRGRGVRVLTQHEARSRLSRLLRGADVLHVHTVRSVLTAIRLAPVRFWQSSISTVHNPYGRFGRALHLTRLTVALASSARPPRLARGRHIFIPNPIIDPLVPDEDGEMLPANAVLYVGGLSLRKGIDVLLEAWRDIVAEVSESSLHLVGNRDAVEFETMAHDLGIGDSVTFHGVRSDTRALMRSATVFVLPSRREGLPLVVLQARQAGAAIVATAVDGTPDALDGGDAGILIPSADTKALSQAVVELLRNDARRSLLAARSREGLDRFSISSVLNQYDEAYALLERRRGRRSRVARAGSAER